MISLEALSRVPPGRRDTVLAREIARMIPVVAPGDELSAVLQQLGESEVAVMDNGGFLGTVSREDLARAMRFKQLESPPRAPPPGWRQRPLGR
jgi:hypothetical protein